MSKVRLQFPISTGVSSLPPAEFVFVRSLTTADLERLRDADADTALAAVTSLPPEMVARLTSQDRAAIIAARRISE